jgi:hypothetical protein
MALMFRIVLLDEPVVTPRGKLAGWFVANGEFSAGSFSFLKRT